MASNRVPIIVKHMTMAIYNKGGIDGSTSKEKFRSAWNIARARLTGYGHLTPGSDQGPGTRIRLTGKGRSRNVKHARENDNTSKNTSFDKLYEGILEDDKKGKEKPT
jgi:hypothetical protein